MDTLALFGAGKLGEALLSGLLRAGRTPEEIVVVERSLERAEYLLERYGVRSVPVAEAVSHAHTLIVAVKPQDVGALLDQLAPLVEPGQLVVSVAAGIPTKYYEQRLAQGVPVIRVMPNTSALVDEAMSVISPGEHADEKHLAAAEALLEPVGKVRRLPEAQQDAVTALSGSGPAYFFFLVEAMIDAGILLGISREVAADLIVQSALGAATMLRDTGQHPVQLREAVTSPGGTTIAAIRELERHGVRAALIDAIEAARDRSVELGKLY